MIKIVIFDMDGVIIDSEYFYKKRMFNFIKQYNSKIKYEDVIETAGFGKYENTLYISKKIGLSYEETNSLYKKYKSQNYISDFTKIENKDTLQLIEYLKNNKFKMALATSGSMEMLKKKLDDLHIQNIFSCIVTGDDVKKYKPDPEIYQIVLNRMNVKPDECMVIEDSTVGIEASKTAGITTIARLNKRLIVDTSRADYQFYDLKDVISLLENEKS